MMPLLFPFALPRPRVLRAAVSLGATLATAGCVMGGGATDPTPFRTVGTLQLELAPAASDYVTTGGGGVSRWLPPLDWFGLRLPSQVIVAPDTVVAGIPFEVTVNTLALDGCWSSDGGELSVSGNQATLTPFDRHATARVCTMVLGTLAHAFTVTFNAPGEGLLRVTGRRVREGDEEHDETVVAERSVVVK